MEKNNTTIMSQPEHESDDREEFRERVDQIIERKRDILNRLAE